MTTLHRCKYDPASAEASLTALQRRRELRYNLACASNEARNLQQSSANQSKAGGVASTGTTGAAKSTGKGGTKGQGSASASAKHTPRENRWEDWSEADRAAFLTHLGEKVRHRLLFFTRVFATFLLSCSSVPVHPSFDAYKQTCR